MEWDKVDLLTCFEAEPEISEDALSYRYGTERAGYRLLFEIWPYEDDVHINLRGPSQSAPVLDLWIHGCIAVRYFRSGQTEGLAFKYRDIERQRAVGFQAAQLLVRPDFSLTVTR